MYFAVGAKSTANSLVRAQEKAYRLASLPSAAVFSPLEGQGLPSKEKMSEDDKAILESPEYKAYHQLVVTECVRLMGERVREFFDKQCDYLEGFEEKRPAEEEAYAQWEAMT